MIDLKLISDVIRKLKPGESILVDEKMLRNYNSEYNGVIFKGEDWVLEDIIGSGYEYQYFQEHHWKRGITFHRLKEPIREEEIRSYVSPDRRHLFEQLPNGLWKIKHDTNTNKIA